MGILKESDVPYNYSGNMSRAPTILLSRLAEGLPGLSPEWGAWLTQACIVSLSSHSHTTGVRLHLLKPLKNALTSVVAEPRSISGNGSDPETFQILWEGEVTEQIRRSWGDQDEATEYGACALAILLILELTPFTVIRRSYKGTGVDYYLGYKDSQEPFEDAARLEVSGLFKATDGEVRIRCEQKMKQTRPSDGTLPAIVIVSEFSKPKSQVVEK